MVIVLIRYFNFLLLSSIWDPGCYPRFSAEVLTFYSTGKWGPSCVDKHLQIHLLFLSLSCRSSSCDLREEGLLPPIPSKPHFLFCGLRTAPLIPSSPRSSAINDSPSPPCIINFCLLFLVFVCFSFLSASKPRNLFPCSFGKNPSSTLLLPLAMARPLSFPYFSQDFMSRIF